MSKYNKIGLLFCIIHIAAVISFVYYLNYISGIDAQGNLMWSYWLIIDFPVSLFVILFFYFDVTSRFMLYFVHGVLGTIWWFFLTALIYKKMFVQKAKHSQ